MSSSVPVPDLRRSSRHARKLSLDTGLLERGYKAFDTKESDHNDGSQDCGAVIRTSDGEKEWVGATGKGGHAEMNALHQLLHECKYDIETFDQLKLEVICEAKPCCVRCAAVLGLLGIKAAGKTYKSPKSMGSTEWGLVPSVRAFMASKLKVSEESIEMIGASKL